MNANSRNRLGCNSLGSYVLCMNIYALNFRPYALNFRPYIYIYIYGLKFSELGMANAHAYSKLLRLFEII